MRNQDGFFGLFFAPLPNLDELIAVKAAIESEKNDQISAIQPMCCRELIFTEPKALVSPLLEEKDQLFLITQKEIFHSPQFQELLQKLNIKSTEPVDLTKSLFQFCFSFTMKQKLAPLWNKAGEFLVQGRDFMQENSKVNAVTLEVTISDKICIGLQAYSLKLTPCKPEHFTASTRALDEFNTNSSSMISDEAISDDLCFVLPSLKKGRIFSITHKIPEDSPFASYEDLRKHWKLMYGYRLPPEENVFYNVHFYYIRGKIFTYPGSCIRSSQAFVSPRCDHQLIFNTFLRDLSSRMPSVCGTALALTSSPVYPTSRLQQATHANHSNLTRTAPQLNHCRPFTIQEQLGAQDSTRQANTSPLTTFMSSQTTTSHIQFVTGNDKTGNQQRTIPFVNQLRITPSNTPLFSYLSSETPFVPRFTSNRIVNSVLEQTVSCNSNCPSTSGTRIVPTFSKKRVQSQGKQPKENDSGQRTVFVGASTPTSTSTVSRFRSLGNSMLAQNASFSASLHPSPRIARLIENATHVHSLSQQSNNQNHVNNFMGRSINRTIQGSSSDISSSLNQESMIESMFTNSLTEINRNPTATAHSAYSSTQVSKCLPQRRPGLVITQTTPISGHVAAPLSSHITQGPKEATVNSQEQRGNRDVNYLWRHNLSDSPTSSLPIPASGPRGHTTLVQPFLTQFQSSADLTRKRQANEFPHEDALQKKPRSKPKLQDSIDVRELAINDQLNKVNAVTLTDWLKKRGVAVKSKDKKSDLAIKVKQHLALVPHEQ